MPRRPNRPCLTQPCPRAAVHQGRCAEHAKPYALARERARGSAHARGYTKRQHVPWRTMVLATHPVCMGYPLGKGACRPFTPATVADHIVPLSLWDRDPAMAQTLLLKALRARGLEPNALDPWSLDNGQGLCASCHNAKTRAEYWHGG
jgi:hypothetical protein